MQELSTTATFALGQPGDDVLTAIFARSVLEAALADEADAEVWLELGSGDGEIERRLAIELSHRDLDEVLGMSSGDEVGLSLDRETVESLFGDADVEAHLVKLPIAIVVSAAAILTPAGQAAVTQVVGTDAIAQRTSPAVSAEVHAAAKAEVVRVGARSEATKTLVVRATGVRSLHATLVR